MHSSRLFCALAIGLLAVGTSVPRINAQAPANGKLHRSVRPLRNHYIVVLRTDVDESAIAPIADGFAHAHQGRRDRIYRRALKGFSAFLSDAAADALSRDPLVRFVEEDTIVSVDASQATPAWGLNRIDQRALPLDAAYTFAATAPGVNVHVVDTGVRVTHAEFAGRAFAGGDYVNDGQAAGTDCNGHGTHVAATAAGSTWGVAKEARIWSHRVLGCDGSGALSDVLAAIDNITTTAAAPAVVNMSLSGPPSYALDEAVRVAVAAGFTYVVAAGNSNANAANYSPGRVPEALTVAATTATDARASFSNYGASIDLFAPGNGIKSAWNTSDTATATLSGTSMAAPHVAGVAALYLEDHPQATPAEVGAVLLSAATANVVTSPGTGSPNLLLYSGIADPNLRPAVSVLSANGGEKLFVGSSFLIEWAVTEPDPVPSIDVSVSLDGGTTYGAVPGCTGLSGAARACAWNAPALATTKGRFRVTARDAGGHAGSDESDGLFLILVGTPLITVTAPNTAVNVGFGTAQTITWNHNLGNRSTVRIELTRDDGASWEILAGSVVNGSSTGAHAWIPAAPATTAARVRVTWTSGPATDVSNVTFTMALPFIKLTAPAGAANWGIGSTQDIRWTHNLGTREFTTIAFSGDGGGTWQTLNAATPNNSAYALWRWMVSSGATNAARIRISWNRDSTVAAQSLVNFTIAAPYIRVTAPSSTATIWPYGTSQRPTWTTNLGTVDTVTIRLSTDGGLTYSYLLAPAAPAKGANVTVPVLETATSSARIRVEWTISPDVQGVNPVNFRVEPGVVP